MHRKQQAEHNPKRSGAAAPGRFILFVLFSLKIHFGLIHAPKEKHSNNNLTRPVLPTHRSGNARLTRRQPGSSVRRQQIRCECSQLTTALVAGPSLQRATNSDHVRYGHAAETRGRGSNGHMSHVIAQRFTIMTPRPMPQAAQPKPVASAFGALPTTVRPYLNSQLPQSPKQACSELPATRLTTVSW